MAHLNFEERVTMAEKLIAFRERDKFSDEAWREWGLNPSPKQLSDFLENLFDGYASDLIDSINENKSGRELRAYLIAALNGIDKNSLDTEERGIVAELMFELSTILGLDIKMKLNCWLYGYPLALLLRIGSVIAGLKRPNPTVVQCCTKCNAELKLVIQSKDSRFSSFSYDILECQKCGELNLFDQADGIKQFRYENATIVEHLEKEHFTREEAIAKMAEIRYRRMY